MGDDGAQRSHHASPGRVEHEWAGLLEGLRIGARRHGAVATRRSASARARARYFFLSFFLSMFLSFIIETPGTRCTHPEHRDTLG